MAETEESSGVASPCVQLCILDEGCGYCLGCGRTRDEIWKWINCSDTEKTEIIERAAQRKLPP